MRSVLAATGFGNGFEVVHSDRIYCSLPFHHSSAALLAMGMCMNAGATIVFRRRFSATRFWQDCFDTQCTVAMYIGEICRYLLAQPPSDVDTKHK